MDRKQLKKYILESFGVESDSPFKDSPEHEVFRHPANKKWFGIILDVKRERLGLSGEGSIDVVNLKCDKLMIGSMRMNEGVFPAYHMNKASWVSVALDGSADDGLVKMLVGMSYELTMPKIKKKKPDKALSEAVRRVMAMEEHYDGLIKAISEGDSEKAVQLSEILSEYYHSGLWLSDYERDERGEFDQSLKRGVLSQDGLYNLLGR